MKQFAVIAEWPVRADEAWTWWKTYHLFDTVPENEQVNATILGREGPWVVDHNETIEHRRLVWMHATSNLRGAVDFRDIPGDRCQVVVTWDWKPLTLQATFKAKLGLRRKHTELELSRYLNLIEEIDRPLLNDVKNVGLPIPQPTIDSPKDFTRNDWKEVFIRTKDQITVDDLSVLAAGVAFYVFLAFIPALAAIISVYGLVADPSVVSDLLQDISRTLPDQVSGMVTDQLEILLDSEREGLGVGLLVSVAAALWGASKGTSALISAVNTAYDEIETRSGVKRRILGLMFAGGGVMLTAVTVGAVAIVPWAAEKLGDTSSYLAGFLRWPILLSMVIVAIALSYRYGPNRENPVPFKWAFPGAIIAAVLWMVGSVAFSFYASNFAEFGEQYGPLGTVVAVLLWMYVSCFAVLLGAELSAETERQATPKTWETKP